MDAKKRTRPFEMDRTATTKQHNQAHNMMEWDKMETTEYDSVIRELFLFVVSFLSGLLNGQRESIPSNYGEPLSCVFNRHYRQSR